MRHTSRKTRRSLERIADSLIQIVTLKQAKGQCIGYADGCTKVATAGHHVCGRRVYPEARHEELNVVAVCEHCHRAIEDNKAHFLSWLMFHLPAHYEFHYVITRGELPRTTVASLRATVVRLRGMLRGVAV